ncbi:class I SAM-dependent methyltransferase [Sorangium sp. So ce363]|uniref:class I SAM-dependent methyltransferase n=1 Tax=Sorangium sp. So ce363 TaxID=3133304 RepID=UPI003F5FAFA9
MATLLSKDSIRSWYARAIGEDLPNDEGLDAPVDSTFEELLGAVDPELPRTAVDLGYGRGHYSIALAARGFAVEAVDHIPARYLRRSLRGKGDLARRITIVEGDLVDFAPRGPYGIVVAKDVLHFLERAQIERLLGATVRASGDHCCHFLTVFTDIRRTSPTGSRIQLDGEADYSAAELSEMIARIYAAWQVEWSWVEHEERDRIDASDGRPYFRAKRATLIARKSTSRPERSPT